MRRSNQRIGNLYFVLSLEKCGFIWYSVEKQLGEYRHDRYTAPSSQQNDRAVMQAYGFDVATTTETSCVAELMRMYQKLVEVE